MKDKFPTILAFGLLILLVIATWWASEYAKKSITVDTAVVKKISQMRGLEILK